MGKKFWGILLAVLMLTVSAGALADMVGTSDGIVLDFWVYSDFTQDVSWEVMKGWAEDFIANDADVTGINFTGKNDNELLTGLMAGVGLPDAFSASARDMKKYYDAIDLLDLSEIYADESWSGGFYDAAIDAVTMEDGKQYALPFISYIPLIYRNLDVLAAAGIDTSKAPATMDEFIAQLEAVKNSGVDATTSWSAGGYFCPGAIMAADADNLTPGIEDSETTLKPEQLVRTLETVARIDACANAMVYSDAVAEEAFKTNKLAFILAGPWNNPGYAASGVNYDVVLVPPYEEGGRTGGLQGWDFMYGVTSDDATRNAATARWLKYMGTEAAGAEWAVKLGRPVLREDSMADESVTSTMIGAVSAVGLKGGMRQMDFGKTNVFWPSALGDIAPQVSSGAMTAEEGAEAMIEAINDMIADEGE